MPTFCKNQLGSKAFILHWFIRDLRLELFVLSLVFEKLRKNKTFWGDWQGFLDGWYFYVQDWGGFLVTTLGGWEAGKLDVQLRTFN